MAKSEGALCLLRKAARQPKKVQMITGEVELGRLPCRGSGIPLLQAHSIGVSLPGVALLLLTRALTEYFLIIPTLVRTGSITSSPLALSVRTFLTSVVGRVSCYVTFSR